MHEFASAKHDLDLALDKDPSYYTARLQRANLALSIGECSIAVEDYQTVLGADPSKKDAQKR